MGARKAKITLNYSLLILELGLLYFIAGKLSFHYLHANGIVNIGVFASEGIALAFILFYGKRVWLGIFLGQFFLAYSNSIELIPSLGISTINSLEAVIGALIFKRLNLSVKLETFRDVLGLILIILTIQIFSAGLSNLLLMENGLVHSSDFLGSLFSWWFGNVMGQLLITPFLLLYFVYKESINLKQYTLYTVVFGAYIYILEVVLSLNNSLLLLSLSLPFVVYTVSQKGFVYGTLLSVVVALVSSYSVYLGTGSFNSGDSLENVVNYNLYVLAHISTVFVTGVLFEERRRSVVHLEETVKKEIAKNEEQQLFLLQQSRLAQMGEMIAMIAHQWRQPLNNLSLVNQLLISKYNQQKVDDAFIEQFKETSKRQINQMSNTIDDFRNYFKPENEKEKFCVNDVIENTLSITQNIYETNSIVIDFYQTNSYYAVGYANSLGQALINIINNAKDAFNEKSTDERWIKIRLKKEQERVVIEIEDNAGGIKKEIADKIFDPYFSTKSSKNGTGLGLYMTKMIIQEQQKGEISFKNSNKGVVFRIEL